MHNKQSIVRALDLGLGLIKYSRSSVRADGSLDVGSIPSVAVMTGTSSSRAEYFTITSAGVQFAVGPDVVEIMASQFLEASFFDSLHCTALAIGALALMEVPSSGTVDVMAVGLPAGVKMKSATVQKLNNELMGCHNLPVLGTSARRDVVVNEVQFFSLQDAAYTALSSFGRNEGSSSGKDLVIDAGHVHLSWTTRSGQHKYDKHSGTITGGVTDLMDVALQQVDVEASSNMRIRQRLDHAIRTNRPSFKINGEPIMTSSLWPGLRARAAENFSRLLSGVGRLAAIDNVYLTGGGAHLYLDQVRGAFPGKIRIMPHTLSHYDNLRGLQILAESHRSSRGTIA